MGKVIKIAELIGTDVRSRSNAGIIQAEIDGEVNEVIIDFSKVTFVSRSFVDELCNIMEKCNNVKLENTTLFIQSMIDAVKQGRNQKRVRSSDDSEIKEFEDIESLSSFLSTI